jgi:regulator of sigma E protease
MSFSDIISLAGQMILSLSILVVLHECGHFFPAKWFKTKVEKFYLFFDPYFSLFKYKKGDTEYGLGWIPFGGYVKIAGMIDESMDTEQMKQPMQPWEFRAKKAWQRLIIMIGGVVVNFILGFFLFGMVLFIWGKKYYKSENIKYGIAVDSLGQTLGLRDGDKIFSIGNVPFDKFNPGTAVKEIVLNNASTFEVERNGEKLTIQIPGEAANSLSDRSNKGKEIFGYRWPQSIQKVEPSSIADKVGIKAGDKILSINGNSDVTFAHEFYSEIRKHKNELVSLNVLRASDTLKLTAQLDSTSKLGLMLDNVDKYIPMDTEKFTLAQAIPGGVTWGMDFLKDQIKAFGQMFKGKIKAKDNLGSVFSIATLFDPSWIWERFWIITAMLSIILAFFNILPIPALDGGYVLFLLIEVFTGKKFSDKTMEYITTGGFLILMTLMLFAVGLDVSRLFGK